MERDGGWVTRVNNHNEGWEEDASEEDREETIDLYLLSWHEVVEIVESCIAVIKK